MSFGSPHEGGSRTKPAPGPSPSSQNANPLPRILGQLRPYRGRSIVILVLIVVASLLGVGASVLLEPMINDGLFPVNGTGSEPPDFGLVLAIGSLMVLLPILRSIVSLYQTYLTNIVGQNVLRDLREQLFAHLQSLSLRFFTATRTGEIQSRLANDVGGLQAVVTETSQTFLTSIAMLATVVGTMFWLSWELALVSVAALPFFIFLTRIVGRIRRKVAAEAQGA